MQAIREVNARRDPFTHNIDCALLCFWLGWVCLCAVFGSGATSQATGFIVFGVATFGAFWQSVVYVRRAFGFGIDDEEIEQDDAYTDETDAPNEHNVSNTFYAAEVKRFHDFLVIICSGRVSQPELTRRGFSGYYHEYIVYCERAGIVSKTVAGKARTLLVSDISVAESKLATLFGKPDYWQVIAPQYERTSPNTLRRSPSPTAPTSNSSNQPQKPQTEREITED